MWCVGYCIGGCCPSLSVIDSDEIVEYYCSVHGELADGFREFTFTRCNVHWPIFGEDEGGS